MLHVASEVSPYSATGGLGLVTAALPRAQRASGLDATLITPLYRFVDRAGLVRGAPTPEIRLDGETWHGRFWATPDGTHLFVDLPQLFDRPHAYGPPGHGYADNPLRFAVFCRVVAHLSGQYDLFHLHDWQAALTAMYLGGARPTVLTIHNLAYQGVCEFHWADRLGIPGPLRTFEGVEYHGRINLLKAGLVLADRLTTVSPRYALEIQHEPGGAGLSGVLRHRRTRLSGVLNGLDHDDWNPITDPALPAAFGADRLEGRATCGAALRAELGLDEGVLFGVVSRATPQKGLDLLAPLFGPLVRAGARFALMLDGEPAVIGPLQAAADLHPRGVALVPRFDPALARRIYGGADFVVVPSRFEPCGMAQLMAMRYGAVPVVRLTGGLADTVLEGETGLTFFDPTVSDLEQVLRRAMALFDDAPGYAALRARSMAGDWSWRGPTAAYATLYEALMNGARR